MGNERRKHQRFPIVMTVHCAQTNELGLSEYSLAITRDLSSGGGCIASARTMAQGMCLVLALETPEHFVSVFSYARVEWARETKFKLGAMFVAGIRFINLQSLLKASLLFTLPVIEQSLLRHAGQLRYLPWVNPQPSRCFNKDTTLGQ